MPSVPWSDSGDRIVIANDMGHDDSCDTCREARRQQRVICWASQCTNRQDSPGSGYCTYCRELCVLCQVLECGRAHFPYSHDGSQDRRRCTSCVTQVTWQCDTCNAVHLLSRATTCCETDEPDEDYDEDGGCNAFFDCDCSFHRGTRSRDRELIHWYSYRPELQFLGTGPRFLGMELEVETSRTGQSPEEVAEAISEAIDGFIYLKEDGSINEGFEMVTHPMSFPFFTERFPWQVLSQLREMGCHTSAENGLHVHVSRKAFECESHIFRWHKLWYRNEEAMTRLARRDPSGWGAFRRDDRVMSKAIAKGYPVRDIPARDYEQLQGQLPFAMRPERYSAINVLNRDTFEVRIFRSTLSPRKARAALGLVDATVEYTRTLTAADVCRKDGWSFERFREWAGDHAEYADLTREMEERV